MSLSGSLQYRRTLNIGIQRLSQGIQLIVPEFLVFCKALFIAGLCQVLLQYCLEISQFLRICCSIFVIGIQLEQIPDHYHQSAGVNQPMIHMHKKTIISFWQLQHGELAHGNIITIKCFICPLLHQFIRFCKISHSGQILQFNITRILFYNILLHISLLIRFGEAYSGTA